MKKGIRILLLLVATAVLMLSATACFGGQTEPGNNGGDDGVVTVVLDSALRTDSYHTIKNHLASFGVSVLMVGESETVTATKNVIYIGEVDSALYASAERVLSRVETEDELDCRYAVYRKDGNAAIIFESDGYGVDGALAEAVNAMIAKGFDSKGAVASGEGSVASGKINTIEYQRELDEVEVEAQYRRLYEEILAATGDESSANEVYNEIRTLYSLYGDGLISWLANLYDPEIGGFYYSNSARDTVGYLPDIESTGQAFSIMVASGLCSNAEIPQWMADAAVRFVKSLQDPNGYFYHPQWGKQATDANTTRRSRDVGKAIGVLNRFGASPTYDTPTGVKGDGVKYDGTLVASLQQRPSSAVISASLITLMGSVSYEGTYLESKASFKTWLDGLDLNSTPYQTYSTGNYLSTQASEIKARDKELSAKGEGGLVKMLTDWLEAEQSPITGLFTGLDYAEMDGVNGLFKISSAYSTLEQPLKYPVEALQSVMEVLETITPESTVRIADTFNVWSTFDEIRTNVKKYSQNEDEIAGVEEFFENLVSNSAMAIRNSTRCLAAFVRDDGSMSWSKLYSASTSQGMPVAVPNSVEGDVNAVALGGVGTVEGIMDMLGFTRIKFYTKGDKILFLSLIEKASPIIKQEAPESEPIDFEYEELGDSFASVDTTDLISGGGVYVCENPTGGKALCFKTVAGATDYVLFSSDSAAFNSSCLIYESDLRITSDAAATAFQIQLHPSVYSLGFYVGENGEIRLTEQSQNSGSNGFINDLGIIGKADEWFKLRIEYYPGESDEVRIKLYLNGELYAVTDNYYGKLKNGESVPKKQFTHVRFIGLSARNAQLLMDNVLITNGKTAYTVEPSPEGAVSGGIAINVDSPDRDRETYAFTADSLPEGVKVTGDSYALTGGALSLQSGAASLAVNKRSAAANSSSVEAALLVDSAAQVGTSYELSYSDLYGNYILKLQLTVENVGGEKRLSLYECTASAKGARINGFSAPLGESFTLGLDHFVKEGAVLISVDGRLTAVTSALLASADRYRFSYFNIKRVDTLNTETTIDMQSLVVERVVKSFEEATAPEGEEKIYDFDNGISDATLSGGVKNSGGAISFSSAKGQAALTVPLNRRGETGNDAAVYFDGAIAAGERNSRSFDVSFTSSGNKLLSFRFTYSDGSIFLSELTENKLYDSLAEFSATSFRLKIEYYPDDGVTEVSVDGKLLLRSSLTYSDGVGAADAVTISSTGAVGLTVDNLGAEIYDRIYVKGAYGLSNSESGSTDITFESATTDSLPSTITTDFRSPGAGLQVVEDVRDGAAGKVLELNTEYGGNDSLVLALTDKVAAATKVTFSFDFRSGSLADADGFEIYFNVGNNGVSKITLKHSGGGLVFYAKGNDGNIDYRAEVPLADWMRLSVVYSITDGQALTELYINGESVGSSYGVIMTGVEVSRINKAEIYTLSASDCCYYFDNISLKQSK